MSDVATARCFGDLTRRYKREQSLETIAMPTGARPLDVRRREGPHRSRLFLKSNR
ncbi:MAG: hypothetical protein AAF668_10080 [Pseudomonadota bacterium]